MKAYVMDAFSEKLFGGNQAGVALPECPLSDAVMQQIAAEFKHSETAFVTVNDDGSVTLRYFTPAGEVDLCGHATIASFALLRQEGLIADGSHIAHTKASDLNIGVSGGHGVDGHGAAEADPEADGGGMARTVRRLRSDRRPPTRRSGDVDRVHRPCGYHDACPGSRNAAAGGAERGGGHGAVPPL